MAMAAIGLNTNIVKLIKSGAKPILLGFTCWVSITCMFIDASTFRIVIDGYSVFLFKEITKTH